MYIAELKGKLSSKQENSEDILTSNVFSFFKYAKRSVFLKEFLSLVDVELTDEELEEARFVFWPTYEDGTEPDMIILAGGYYLLFEAKYRSSFTEKSGEKAGQIQRELEWGRKDAGGADEKGKMAFKMIAVTADYRYPSEKIPEEYRAEIKWISWRSVSEILLNALEQEDIPNSLFAQDLYDLLVKKRLRGFLSFDRLSGIYMGEQVASVFFSAQSSSFRGRFIGFDEALEEQSLVEDCQGKLFYSRNYFRNLLGLNLNRSDFLFYRRQT